MSSKVPGHTSIRAGHKIPSEAVSCSRSRGKAGRRIECSPSVEVKNAVNGTRPRADHKLDRCRVWATLVSGLGVALK